MDVLDTVIIGAGPAGMTAAIYARRKGLSLALVAASIGGNMSLIGDLENYPGFESVAGAKLVARMHDQLQRLGVVALVDRVVAVEKAPGGYAVRTEGRRSFEARSVIVASGSHWRELGVPGEREFVNRGVSFCSTCDAPLFRGMDVAVVGGGNRAAESVLDLTHIAARVYMIVRSRLKADQVTVDRIRGSDKVKVLEGYTVQRISGGDFVESIEVVEAAAGRPETLNVGGVFVEIGLDPNVGFLHGLVRLNDRAEIVVDKGGRTSDPGIFAAGDVTDGLDKQVVVAAGEGARAALSAYAYVSSLK